MANYNRVILLGHLTRDPEVRHTQSGTAVAKLGIAVNRKTKDGGSVCFVDLVAFGKTAELIGEHLHKGDPMFVEGRLEYSSWEAPDGSKRSRLEVVVETFQFLNSGDKRPNQQSLAPARELQEQDIPF